MSKFKNIVLFAAGGGNDIFSTLAYVKAQLPQHNYQKIAIIGVLGITPFHSNTPIIPNYVNVESPLIIPASDLNRYLPLHPPKKIYNSERLLPELIKESFPEVNNYVCMSSKYSAPEQANNLRKLFSEWEMEPQTTLLNIVDFGGDILTNGNQSTLISPELDAFTLAVVQNLKEYQRKISICFPGVDGELQKDYLGKVCQNSSKELININEWHESLNKVYDKIKDSRKGNTIPNMLEILKKINDPVHKLDCNVSLHWSINGKVIQFQQDLDIDMELQRYVHHFDDITYNPFVTVFNSPDYDLLKVVQHTDKIYQNQLTSEDSVQTADAFLQYLRKDLDSKWTNKHILYDESNNKTQDVMLVDILPYVVPKEKRAEIKILPTFNLLYSEL
ncbi:protein of unknown function DUF1152 [Klosneuvirus KNV1]|uniref:DUF1152 domain-containing protein n=1 Tax=Klosneuvirus KNV1 TaxID=1977640 RepID=A0A1V0SJT1_9VIRU|nr:protein of unknown function DUF1152 [Klosneuvirus KNV1]